MCLEKNSEKEEEEEEEEEEEQGVQEEHWFFQESLVQEERNTRGGARVKGLGARRKKQKKGEHRGKREGGKDEYSGQDGDQGHSEF